MNLTTFRKERAARIDTFLDRLVEHVGETFPNRKEASGATRRAASDAFDVLENEAHEKDDDVADLLLIVEELQNGIHFMVKRMDSQTLGEYTKERNRIHNRLAYPVHFERVELGDNVQGYLLVE